MDGTAIHRRLRWQLATLVRRVAETQNATSLMFALPEWPGHLAGQHVDVRLTAEDGYQAERSYSIASAPGEEHVTITVERVPDGEVSPFLIDELRVGETIEIRGPIGGFFVWDHAVGGPILLLAGGSGIVPLRSILRHRANLTHDTTDARLLYSARRLEDVIYRQDLAELGGLDHIDVRIALTRQWPDDWQGLRGRLDTAAVEAAAWPAGGHSLTYICGPTPFVEALSSALVGLGHDPASIKTERFGPTGR